MESSEHLSLSEEQSSFTKPLLNAMAFTVAFDPESNSSKNFNLKDSIKKFAPPKPETIDKQRSPKTKLELKETVKANNAKLESGHISDSACYLIQRMLIESDLYNNNESKSKAPFHSSNSNRNHSSATPKQSQRSSSAGEKDSGVCDDKSESGTYTINQNDPDLEAARKKIDQVFGVSNINANSSSLSHSSLFSSSFAALKTIWNPSYESSKEKSFNNSKKCSNESLKGSNISSLSRSKKNSFSNGFLTPSSCFVNDVNLPKSLNVSSKSDIEIKSKPPSLCSKALTDKVSSKSTSFKKINDTTSLPLKVEKYREFNHYQTFFKSFNEDSNSIKSDAGSTVSTEPNSIGSGKYKNETTENSNSLRFNRAFALRRAKLGMDTLGVPLNLTKSKQSHNPIKMAAQVTPKINTSLSFNRNDGGRFSLRISTSNSEKPPLPSRNRWNQNLSREDINQEIKIKNRSYSTSSDSESSQRNKSLTDSNLNSKNFLQKNSLIIDKKKVEINLYKSQNQNHKELSSFEVNKKVFSNKTHALIQAYENTSTKTGISKSVLESKNKQDLKQSSELIAFKSNSMSERKSNKKELSILDNIVISAIHQLSHKLKNNLQNIIETERDKHPNGSDINLMIQELLPQVLESERKFEDVDVSINLSNTLKNLKKVEQSLDVINLLLEHHSVLKSSSNNFDHKLDNMQQIANDYLDEY